MNLFNVMNFKTSLPKKVKFDDKSGELYIERLKKSTIKAVRCLKQQHNLHKPTEPVIIPPPTFNIDNYNQGVVDGYTYITYVFYLKTPDIQSMIPSINNDDHLDGYYDGFIDGINNGSNGFLKGFNDSKNNVPNELYSSTSNYTDFYKKTYTNISLSIYNAYGNGYLKAYNFYNGVYDGRNAALNDVSNNTYNLPNNDCISVFTSYSYTNSNTYPHTVQYYDEYKNGFYNGYNNTYIGSTYYTGEMIKTYYLQYVNYNVYLKDSDVNNFPRIDPKISYGYDFGIHYSFVKFREGKLDAATDFNNNINTIIDLSNIFTPNFVDILGSNAVYILQNNINNPYQQGYSYGMGFLIGNNAKYNRNFFGVGYFNIYVVPSDNNYAFSNGLWIGYINDSNNNDIDVIINFENLYQYVEQHPQTNP